MGGDQEVIAQFVRQGTGLREVLQIVEEALVDGGYDDFVMTTERGIFHWQTYERGRPQRILNRHNKRPPLKAA